MNSTCDADATFRDPGCLWELSARPPARAHTHYTYTRTHTYLRDGDLLDALGGVAGGVGIPHAFDLGQFPGHE